jgi:hypothetical protein
MLRVPERLILWLLERPLLNRSIHRLTSFYSTELYILLTLIILKPALWSSPETRLQLFVDITVK